MLLLRFRLVTTITRYRKKNLAFFSNPIGTISLKYKQKIHFKLFCILYSEREYTLLHFAVQLLYYHYSHPPKKMKKLPQKVKFEANFGQKIMMLAAIINKNSFLIRKKSSLSPTVSLLQTYISVMNYLYKNL